MQACSLFVRKVFIEPIANYKHNEHFISIAGLRDLLIRFGALKGM